MPSDKHRVNSDLSALIEGNVFAEAPSENDLSVFIVGPTGSGKTTYIDRFFSNVLPPSTREHCLSIHINCLDASGDERRTIGWITEEIICALEKGYLMMVILHTINLEVCTSVNTKGCLQAI